MKSDSATAENHFECQDMQNHVHKVLRPLWVQRKSLSSGLQSNTDILRKAFYEGKGDFHPCFLILTLNQWQFTYLLAAAQYHSFSSAPPSCPVMEVNICLQTQEGEEDTPV